MKTNLKCLRCGAKWNSYSVALHKRLPKFCPICHAPKWNVPKERGL